MDLPPMINEPLCSAAQILGLFAVAEYPNWFYLCFNKRGSLNIYCSYLWCSQIIKKNQYFQKSTLEIGHIKKSLLKGSFCIIYCAHLHYKYCGSVILNPGKYTCTYAYIYI